ncbi:30S ribosomal protein S17 [Jeotgalibaca caeni]|uniref:30S ribosomal protein S17 n=1 Tax=Jeotgalibaca caeni TaxID=3028623 RepID=UPI00237D9592|nr:30S ribosomal protein S17 [Jeotgalibaca caeni]MDE1548093.1 30S ribosomal protein S17 [Jeotgalibaca caeni]
MTEERNKRKVYQGRVVSDKMDKTITVEVSTYKNHPRYGKRVRYSKKYKAHDENNQAKMGDVVRIMETRPLSATKNFRLLDIVEESVII